MRLSKNQLYGPLDYMVLSSVSPASPYISTTFFQGFFPQKPTTITNKTASRIQTNKQMCSNPQNDKSSEKERWITKLYLNLRAA
jgi:hypothetical protein